MRVGIFAPGITIPKGWENNVSGHVQVPMGTARTLTKLGHDVHVIGTQLRPDDVLPVCQIDTGTLHLIPDGRHARAAKGRNSAIFGRLQLVRQISGITHLIRTLDLEVIHLFGFARTARLAQILAMIERDTPVVSTLLGPVNSTRNRLLGRGPAATITATEFVRGQCQDSIGPIAIIRHGLIRNLRDEVGRRNDSVPVHRNRVLFWREADHMSGADLALEAFRRLAPDYPNHQFDLALRPSPYELRDFEIPIKDQANIQIHRFPYRGGHSLASLIAESICVVLPFRSLSIHPQFAIAESMAAGSTIVSTSVGSTPELIESGRNGILVEPENVSELLIAIKSLIEDPSSAGRMGVEATHILQKWNWNEYGSQLVDLYRSVILGRNCVSHNQIGKQDDHRA